MISAERPEDRRALKAYHRGMEDSRQRVIGAVTVAIVDGIGEDDLADLIAKGIAQGQQITEARRPIDLADVPTVGSVIRKIV